MRLVEIGSEISELQGYQLTSFIFARGLQKTPINWQQGMRESIGYQKKVIFSDIFEVFGQKLKRVS